MHPVCPSGIQAWYCGSPQLHNLRRNTLLGNRFFRRSGLAPGLFALRFQPGSFSLSLPAAFFANSGLFLGLPLLALLLLLLLLFLLLLLLFLLFLIRAFLILLILLVLLFTTG